MGFNGPYDTRNPRMAGCRNSGAVPVLLSFRLCRSRIGANDRREPCHECSSASWDREISLHARADTDIHAYFYPDADSDAHADPDPYLNADSDAQPHVQPHAKGTDRGQI